MIALVGMKILLAGTVFGVPALAAVVAILLYGSAVASRKSYSCPACGEKAETEHMDAKRCNTCGAVLQEETEE